MVREAPSPNTPPRSVHESAPDSPVAPDYPKTGDVPMPTALSSSKHWADASFSFSPACLPTPRIGDEMLLMGEEADQYDHALCRNTSFANLTGLPALAIPAGLEAGLPIGVQLAARHFDDHRLLAAGQVLWEMLDPPRLAPI